MCCFKYLFRLHKKTVEIKVTTLSSVKSLHKEDIQLSKTKK